MEQALRNLTLRLVTADEVSPDLVEVADDVLHERRSGRLAVEINRMERAQFDALYTLLTPMLGLAPDGSRIRQ